MRDRIIMSFLIIFAAGCFIFLAAVLTSSVTFAEKNTGTISGFESGDLVRAESRPGFETLCEKTAPHSRFTPQGLLPRCIERRIQDEPQPSMHKLPSTCEGGEVSSTYVKTIYRNCIVRSESEIFQNASGGIQNRKQVIKKLIANSCDDYLKARLLAAECK